MQPIGDVLKRVTANVRETPGTTGSGGEGPPPPDRRHGGSGGSGDPDCERCRGLGWVRREVPVEHPDFGRAFPCECIADRMAERKLEGVRRASNIAALETMTFDAFQTAAPGNSPEQIRSLETAFRAAERFADEPSGWLFFHGGYGTGKTHLAAAIVNHRLRKGASALFVVVPDLLDYLRAAFAPGAEDGFDARFEAVRQAPLLVLDDLGTQSPTAWAGEKLFQILNHRYNMQLPTVITSNLAPEDMEPRLSSRLEHFDVVRVFNLRAIDYRGGNAREGKDISSLGFYRDMTFQTWDDRRSQVTADVAMNLAKGFQVARSFVDDPEGWLVLLGGHGSGKTHLAASVANAWVAQGGDAVFVVVPDLLDHLRATFSPSSRVGYDKRFEEVRQAPLLVLDDLGTESATPWAQEKLFQLLNHRYAARLPTVITSSTGLGDIHPRLRTRMADRRRCVIFELMADTYHGPSNPSGSNGRNGSGGGRSGRSGGRRGRGR